MMDISALRRQIAFFRMQYPDYVLLFRNGDRFDAYDDDALTLAKVFGSSVSKTRERDGTRYDHYLLDDFEFDDAIKRMTGQGYKVALFEQANG